MPLCILLALWIFSEEGVAFQTNRFRFALVIALITGVQNIYYTNVFVQFVLLGGLLQAWRHGARALFPSLGLVGMTAAAFTLMNLNSLERFLTDGPNGEAVVRQYQWIEIYGLKLVDFVVPPPDHPFPPFAAWGAAHLKEVYLSPAETPPSGYFGLVGLGALAWLVVESLRRAAGRERLPIEAWLVLWIVLYANVGGLNGMAGAMGLELFRSMNRCGIFVLAIVLLFATQRLSFPAWSRRSSTYAIAIAVVALALWDQSPPIVNSAALEAIQRDVASDRAFTAEMDSRLPDGAMVFQIPVVDFPEVTAPGLEPYDHFRPYFYTSRLRFSYGSDKGRPQDQWQHELLKMPFPAAVARLESYGFGALYLNLSSIDDHGATLIKQLQQMGRGDMFTSQRGDLLCVVLQRAPQSVTPDEF